MDKITIAFVHHTVKRGGGSEQVLYDIINGLNPDKFRPVLCCLYGSGELGEQLRSQGCVTYQNLVETPTDPRNSMRIASILRKERADILFVSDAFHNVIVGRLAATQARTPISALIFHTFDTVIRQGASFTRRTMLEMTDKFMYPQFDHAIALAETHKDYLISTKHIPGKKISVVYNGVEPERFTTEVDVAAIRAELQVPDDAHVVGIVAGLRRWKAHDMFLNAAQAVLLELPNTYFIIVGDGPDRQRLEEMAQQLNIEDHVRFLGVVANVSQLLRVFDVSTLSSIHEALPITLLEAMAAERPVVATDVGSVCEIVEDGVTGFLTPSGDADRFAQSILRILKDPALGRAFGLAGRQKIEKQFTVERMVHQYETLFTKWVDEHRQSVRQSQRGPTQRKARPWTPQETKVGTVDDSRRN